MRPQIVALQAKKDLTEAEFSTLLSERDLAKEEGREEDYADCLMLLSHFVKWVRSDNHEDPFTRSNTLALEALAIFERIGNVKGQVAALRYAAVGLPPDKSTEFLDRALILAKELGDEIQVAWVLSRQAAKAGLANPELAMRLTQEALALFKRNDDREGQAACYFSLTIQTPDRTEKVSYAITGADLYESVEDFNNASKCLSLVLMYGSKTVPLDTQQQVAEKGLMLAQRCCERLQEGSFYRELARIHKDLGNIDESRKFQRWQKDIEESDGLNEKQRKRNNKLFAKQMSAFAKLTGNMEAAKMFENSANGAKKRPPDNG